MRVFFSEKECDLSPMLSLIPGGRWAHPPKANSTESGGETNTADQGKTKEVRKGNKRNSDIRKEQNKIASRTYSVSDPEP